METVREATPAAAPYEGTGSGRLALLALRRDRGELPARIVTARISIRTRFRQIIVSRELLTFLIRKELKVKYKSSVLGLLWSMVNPAVVLAVYYLVFTYFLKSGIPYFALFLFSGLIVWNLFSTSLTGASSSIVSASGIVKKVAFPREVLVLAQVGTGTIFFFFQGIVLVLFLIGFRFQPAWHYLPLVAFGLVDLIVLTCALSLFLAAINVYLRDVEHLVQVLIQAWFWGVPIIYSFERLVNHPLLQKLYLADPMVTIVLSFQRAIYGLVTYVPKGNLTQLLPYWPGLSPLHASPVLAGLVPNGAATQLLPSWPMTTYLDGLGIVLGASLLALFGALILFGRVEGNFAEEL